MKEPLASLFIWAALLATAAAASPVASGIRLACVGDSITEGVGVKDRGHDSYPAQLAQLLGNKWEVRNFGVSGATLLQTGDKPYIRESAYQQALDFKPDVVVIALGTNDTKPQNIEAHANDFEPNYRELIAAFRAANPTARIYACLPVPVFPENWGIRETVLAARIIPSIRKVAAGTKTPVIDLHAALAGQNRCFPDRVHPNEEGAGRMARAIYQSITGLPAPPLPKVSGSKEAALSLKP